MSIIQHGNVIEGALQRYGVTLGQRARLFHVDPVNGPFLTLQAAIDESIDDLGDVIVVEEGTHNVSSSVLFNKRGITVAAAMMGMAERGELSTIQAAAGFTDGPAATIKSPCRILGLGFAGRNTSGPSLLFQGDVFGGFNGAFSSLEECRFQNWNSVNSAVEVNMGDFNNLVRCTFDGGTAGFGTAAILVTGSQAEGVSRLRVMSSVFSGVGSGKHAIKHDTTGGPHGILYAHNYMERGQTPTTDALGKFLDNDSNTAHGLIADNWLGGMTNKADAFKNLTNSNLKFADNHYEEA